MSCTAAKVVREFLRWAEVSLAPATYAAYAHQLGKVPPRVLRKQTRRLRPLDLTSWARTWHEYQGVMRAFNWAVTQAKMLRRNPFAGLRMPGRNERQRTMQPQQVAQFLRAARPAARRFLLALRETLARPQEVRAACWDDLAPERPGVAIEDALRAGSALIVLREYKDRARRADPNKPRVLLVTRRLGRMLLRLRRLDPSATGEIFRNSKGEPWTRNAVRCLMRRLRRRLDITRDKWGETIVAYTFRHTTATHAAAAGVRDRVLADLLGHVETRTTHRYQHLCVDHLRAALLRAQKRRIEGA